MQYLSSERLEQLKQEFAELKKRRLDIAKRLEEAKAQGDLSENAEYQEAKEEQAFNEGKILELAQIIRNAVVIENRGRKNDVVRVGSAVKVKSNNGTQIFNIVGSEEADPFNGRISNESPTGRAFLDKKVGEEVEVETPKGKMKYKIVGIE
jgi:transcription elongation factor GreA